MTPPRLVESLFSRSSDGLRALKRSSRLKFLSRSGTVVGDRKKHCLVEGGAVSLGYGGTCTDNFAIPAVRLWHALTRSWAGRKVRICLRTVCSNAPTWGFVRSVVHQLTPLPPCRRPVYLE